MLLESCFHHFVTKDSGDSALPVPSNHLLPTLAFSLLPPPTDPPPPSDDDIDCSPSPLLPCCRLPIGTTPVDKPPTSISVFHLIIALSLATIQRNVVLLFHPPNLDQVVSMTENEHGGEGCPSKRTPVGRSRGRRTLYPLAIALIPAPGRGGGWKGKARGWKVLLEEEGERAATAITIVVTVRGRRSKVGGRGEASHQCRH